MNQEHAVARRSAKSPTGPVPTGVRLELSRRGDYAVRAAIAIARHAEPSPLSARRIAESMAIPSRFVAHVLGDLARAGIVIGTPGRAGGYRLAAPAESIDLLRIVDAAGEPAASRCVLRGVACGLDETCAAHEAFAAATAAMRAELAGRTLAELAARS